MKVHDERRQIIKGDNLFICGQASKSIDFAALISTFLMHCVTVINNIYLFIYFLFKHFVTFDLL